MSLVAILDDLIKAGEGSRGGKVVGHTPSGKPIYEHHFLHHVENKIADFQTKLMNDDSLADHPTPKPEKKKPKQLAFPRKVTHVEKRPEVRMSIDAALDDLIKGGEGSRGGHVIGHTKSGKPIYSVPEHSAHKDFGPAEHFEAAELHKKLEKEKAKRRSMKHLHQNATYEHENNAMRQTYSNGMWSVDSALDDLIKGGEGSRGGKIIGHTRTGKPIYSSAGNANHKHFTKEDHEDAAGLHTSLQYKHADEHHNTGKMERGIGGGMVHTVSEKDQKKMKQLQKLIDHHAHHCAKHRNKAFPESVEHSPDQRDFDRADRKNDPGHRSRAWSKKSEVSMPKKEFVAEHKHLVGVLESPSRKDDKLEAKKQKKELDEKMGKSVSESPNLPKSFSNKGENMDIFKSLGIVVGERQSVVETTSTVVKSFDIGSDNARIGFPGNARDRLEAGLMKGQYGDENLKNTHGEQFHKDNDKTVEKQVTESEVVDPYEGGEHPSNMKLYDKRMRKVAEVGFDNEVPPPKNYSEAPTKSKDKIKDKTKKKSLSQTELFIKATDEVEKGFDFQKPIPKAKKKAKAKLPPIGCAKKSEEIEFDELFKKAFERKELPKAGKLIQPKKEENQVEAEKQAKKDAGFEANPRQREQAMAVRDQMSAKKSCPHCGEGHCSLPKVPEKETVGAPEKRVPVMRQHEGKPARKSLIKAVGPGGILFDFGARTGNPVADNATAMLNHFADPVQSANADDQRKSYDGALVEYVTKGEREYSAKHQNADFGAPVHKGWNEQLSKPMDQQVAEAFKAGALDDKGYNRPSTFTQEMNVGGELVKAQSPTDAAIIEMMKAGEPKANDGAIVADCTGAGAEGKQGITVDLTK